jgi:hypothetical protein
VKRNRRRKKKKKKRREKNCKGEQAMRDSRIKNRTGIGKGK